MWPPAPMLVSRISPMYIENRREQSSHRINILQEPGICARQDMGPVWILGVEDVKFVAMPRGTGCLANHGVSFVKKILRLPIEHVIMRIPWPMTRSFPSWLCLGRIALQHQFRRLDCPICGMREPSLRLQRQACIHSRTCP